MIGAARPSIADPFLPAKIEQGRYDEIRECIGCNACYSRSIWRPPPGLHAERDRRRGAPPRLAPRALRAGGERRQGRARGRRRARPGMECAIGARQARHASACTWSTPAPRSAAACAGSAAAGPGRVGPRDRLPRASSSTSSPTSPIDLGTRLDGATTCSTTAREIVVIATGARWAGDGMNGVTHGADPRRRAALPHVLTPEQVMVEGKRPPGGRVAVVDCEGYFTGAGMAELLRGEGYEVTFVTPLRRGRAPTPTRRWRAAPAPARCTSWASGRDARRDGHARSTPAASSGMGEFGAPSTLEADARRAGHAARLRRRALPRAGGRPEALEREGIEAVYRVGDCVAPRLIADAIFDGHRAGPRDRLARPGAAAALSAGAAAGAGHGAVLGARACSGNAAAGALADEVGGLLADHERATIGLTVGMVGKIEPSAIDRPSIPRTRSSGSTTARSSSAAPIRQVPDGW